MANLTKQEVEKAISLGSLNPKVLNDFFNTIRKKAYDYDYLIQQTLVDLKSFKINFYEWCMKSKMVTDGITTGSMDRIIPVSIELDMVHYAKRKNFRLDKSLYGKVLSQSDIMKHRDIFKYTILCFLNNKLVTDFRIHPKDDRTELYFPFKTYQNAEFTDILEIVAIPEALVYESIQLALTTETTSLAVNTTKFPGIDLASLAECSQFIVFMTDMTTKDSTGALAKPTTVHVGVTWNKITKSLNFENAITYNTSHRYVFNIVGIEHLDQIIKCTGDTKYLKILKTEKLSNDINGHMVATLGDRKMPVPKDNLLILVKDKNKVSYHINTDEIKIKEYYPYIYEIENNTRQEFIIFVLYKDQPSSDIQYDIEIPHYLDNIDLLTDYEDGTVPTILKEYKPLKWDYSIKNYYDKFNIDTVDPDPWTPLLYKATKVSEMYKDWCLFYQTYLKMTYGFAEGWDVNIADIKLSSRARMNTSRETTMNSNLYETFDAIKYVFTYNNGGSDVAYSWFIDGKFVTPYTIISLEGLTHVYFNKTDINQNSVMHVERADGNVFATLVQVKTSPVTITMNMINKPILANSLVLTTEDGTYLTNNEYNVYAVDNVYGNHKLDLTNSVYIIEQGSQLIIEPSSAAYQNKNIRIFCNNGAKSFSINAQSIDSEDTFAGIISLNRDVQLSHTAKYILDRIRIYDSEGRLYPKYGYTQIPHDNIEQAPEFYINTDIKNETNVKVQYLGYSEKLVYSADNITVKGVLNLEGKITKPFSHLYHDVFLDGYRLDSHNIEIISPFNIIIRNVKTTRRLEIYEKIKGDEIFAFDNNEVSRYLADSLFKEDTFYYNKILNSLTNIITDPNIKDLDEKIDILMTITKFFLLLQYVDADRRYNFEEYGIYIDGSIPERIFLNADDRIGIDTRNNILISHDITIANDVPEPEDYMHNDKLKELIDKLLEMKTNADEKSADFNLYAELFELSDRLLFNADDRVSVPTINNSILDHDMLYLINDTEAIKNEMIQDNPVLKAMLDSVFIGTQFINANTEYTQSQFDRYMALFDKNNTRYTLNADERLFEDAVVDVYYLSHDRK